MEQDKLDRLLRDNRLTILNDFRLQLEQAKSAGIEATKFIHSECSNDSEYLETLRDVFKPRTRT